MGLWILNLLLKCPGGDDVEITDEILAYESMWALHMIPFGILAITTAIVVKGEALAKLAMTASASMVLIVGGGMMYFTNHYGYSTEGTMAIVMPLVVMGAAILMGVGGYLHLNEESEEGAAEEGS